MNIALYIRLSKEDEINQESKSISSQKSYLRDYIKKFKYKNIYEYIDDGYTGTNFNRPGFKQLLKDIENKKIDTIVTKDSSRLGRNISWVTYYIEEYFPSKKIRYISIDDNYDSEEKDSTNSDLLIFKSLFNEYYCKDISKKIKSSLKIKKIEGKYTGWKAPYGYKRKKEDYHKIEIDNAVKDNVILIFKLALNNNSPSTIANILNNKKIASPLKYINQKNSKWTSKTIKDILQNPTYIGNLTQGKRKKVNYKLKQTINVPKEEWIIKENTHDAIIDQDTFNKVQDILIKYKNVKYNKIITNELINILYCKECGSKIGLNKKKYCVCNKYKKYYKDKLCTPHTFNYKKIKEIIKKELDKEILNILIPNITINDLVLKKRYLENRILKENKEQDIKIFKEELDIIIKRIKEIYFLKNNSNIYIELIDKIFISENGTIELYLNYNH